MINLKEISMVGFRSILILVLLFFSTKILGKKQISQMTIYDYIIGITIGSIAADITITLDEKLFNGVFAILIFGFIGFFLSYLSIKSIFINNMLNGKAVILMAQGDLYYENLRKTKITISKFLEQARLNGYYDLNVLNYAILETNGEISFLAKEEYQSSTPIDFKTELNKGTKQLYCKELIIDGEIRYDELDKLKKDEKWLMGELKKKKVNSYKKVVLATIDDKGKVNIYKY